MEHPFDVWGDVCLLPVGFVVLRHMGNIGANVLPIIDVVSEL